MRYELKSVCVEHEFEDEEVASRTTAPRSGRGQVGLVVGGVHLHRDPQARDTGHGGAGQGAREEHRYAYSGGPSRVGPGVARHELLRRLEDEAAVVHELLRRLEDEAAAVRGLLIIASYSCL